MTVAELIEELKQHDGNLEVHFHYNYGDHWRTQVAPKVDMITVGSVIHSGYHNMPKVVDEDIDEAVDEANDATTLVVLLGQ